MERKWYTIYNILETCMRQGVEGETKIKLFSLHAGKINTSHLPEHTIPTVKQSGCTLAALTAAKLFLKEVSQSWWAEKKSKVTKQKRIQSEVQWDTAKDILIRMA